MEADRDMFEQCLSDQLYISISIMGGYKVQRPDHNGLYKTVIFPGSHLLKVDRQLFLPWYQCHGILFYASV